MRRRPLSSTPYFATLVDSSQSHSLQQVSATPSPWGVTQSNAPALPWVVMPRYERIAASGVPTRIFIGTTCDSPSCSITRVWLQGSRVGSAATT